MSGIMIDDKEQWIRDLAAESTSLMDFAKRTGYSYPTVNVWKRVYQLDIPDGRYGNTKSGDPEQVERNYKIWDMKYNLGYTYDRIAKEWGISRQRAYAIASKEAKRLAKEA